MASSLVDVIETVTGWNPAVESRISYQFNEAVGAEWKDARNLGSESGSFSSNPDMLTDGYQQRVYRGSNQFDALMKGLNK